MTFQTCLTLVSLLTASVSAQHVLYQQQQQPVGYYYLEHRQPVGGNEFLYAYPPHHQLTGQFPLRQVDGGEGGVGEAPEPPVGVQRPPWWEAFLAVFRPPSTTETTPVIAAVEEPTPSPPTPEVEAAPEKPVEGEKLAALETLDEIPADGETPAAGDGDGDGDDERAVLNAVPNTFPDTVLNTIPDTKYVRVEQPQFYGSFEGVQHLPGRHQADSNFVFFRSAPKPFPQHPPPEFPHTYYRQRGAFLPGGQHVDISQAFQPLQSLQPIVPGRDADGETLQTFQQPGLINVGPGYQNVYFLAPRQTVDHVETSMKVVQMDTKKNNTAAGGSVEVHEEQAGPSVAQAKPQAIALAGPGGVAAATPIATALVGPGGLAVAAPTATAVAGQTGGGTLTGAAAAAVNKYLAGAGAAKKGDKTAETLGDFRH